MPATEGGGRVHTSTATVAIMPEVDEVEVVINPEDIEISTARSSGAGIYPDIEYLHGILALFDRLLL